jgi:hypothetical protein
VRRLALDSFARRFVRVVKPSQWAVLALRTIRLVFHTRTKKEAVLARRTIFVSDLTGKTIDEKDAATVTIRYADARKGQVVLDVNASEVADLASKGTKQARRGRKPKAAA